MKQRTEIVTYKVSREEKLELEELAKEAGISVSEFCRTRIFEYKHRNVPVLELPDGTKIPVGEIEKGRIILDIPG